MSENKGTPRSTGAQGTGADSDSDLRDVYRRVLDEVVSDEEFRPYRAYARKLIDEVNSANRFAIMEEAQRARISAALQRDRQLEAFAFSGKALTAARWSFWGLCLASFVAVIVSVWFVVVISGQNPVGVWGVLAAAAATAALTIAAWMRLRSRTIARRRAKNAAYDATRNEEIVVRDSLRVTVSAAYSRAIADLLKAQGLEPFPHRAPRLVELDADSVVPLRSIEAVSAFVMEHPTSAIGITGPRGVGKSTLLAAVCDRVREAGGAAVLIPAPVEHDPLDVLRSIAVGLREVDPAASGSDRDWAALRVRRGLQRSRLVWSVAMIYGGIIIVVLGLFAVVYPGAVGLAAKIWPVVPGFLLIIAGIAVAYQRNIYRSSARVPELRSSRQLLDEMIDALTFEKTSSDTLGGSVSAGAVGLKGEHSQSRKARTVSHAQLSAALREVLRSIGDETNGPFVVAIDELDKLPTRQALLSTVNAIKDLLHLRNVHFAVSLSDEALSAFDLRETSERDAFDSTFDTIIDVERLDSRGAIAVVESRVTGVPTLLTLSCHVWAGGLPRDLLRHVRACVEHVQRRDQVPTWHQVAMEVTAEEAARKVATAVRSGSTIEGASTVARLTSLWRTRCPRSLDLDFEESLDDTSRRLFAYVALRFAAVWAILDAQENDERLHKRLDALRDAVVASSTDAAVRQAQRTLDLVGDRT